MTKTSITEMVTPEARGHIQAMVNKGRTLEAITEDLNRLREEDPETFSSPGANGSWWRGQVTEIADLGERDRMNAKREATAAVEAAKLREDNEKISVQKIADHLNQHGFEVPIRATRKGTPQIWYHQNTRMMLRRHGVKGKN